MLREIELRQALGLADRVLPRVAAIRIPVEGREIAPTVSIGVAEIGSDDVPKTWFDRADRGLYAAKSAGRNRAMLGESEKT